MRPSCSAGIGTVTKVRKSTPPPCSRTLRYTSFSHWLPRSVLDVWTKDVKQAFLQRASALQRRIFFKPNALELGYDEFLHLVLPLYGLCESGDYWRKKIPSHYINESKLEQNPGDPSLIYRGLGKDQAALSGNYVYDLLLAAQEGHRRDLEKSLRASFECSPSQDLLADRLGYELSSSHRGLHTAMKAYIL